VKSIEAVLVSSFDLEDAIKICSSSSLFCFNGCLINQILIIERNPERLEFVLFYVTSRIFFHKIYNNLESLEFVLPSSMMP
jgi:hypothetical protein